jgi:hypothetical protein
MNIFKDGVLVDVNVSYWSGAKMLTPKDLGLKDEDVVDAYKLGKKMLIPEAIIKEFRTVEQRARYLVDQNSFRFPIGTARFIPKKKFVKVLDELKECQAKYNVLTDSLITNYEAYRTEMVTVYTQAAEQAFMRQLPSVTEFGIDSMEANKIAFIEDFLARIKMHYPDITTLRGKFSLCLDVYEIALPRMRKADSQDIVDEEVKRDIATEEYKAQTHSKINKFMDEVVASLRQEASTICGKIIANIKEGKVIRERSLQSLRTFVDQFSDLNFVGDKKVEEQLNGLKKNFLDTHTGETLTENKDVQEEFSRKLGELVSVAENMTDINEITGEYQRSIDW